MGPGTAYSSVGHYADMRHCTVLLALAMTVRAQPVEPVIRISTSLVQIDAIVTDNKTGRLVTDLRATDFEISQDSKRRDTTAFSFVQVTEAARKPSTGVPPPASGNGVAPEQVRRTMAIVVDDLSLAFPDLVRVRDAVKGFVGQLGDGDVAAIVPMSGGMGIYSQFTTDRALLTAAADMIRLNPWASPMDAPSPLVGAFSEEVQALRAGALGSLQTAIRGLRNMPGRKSLVLISSGYYAPNSFDAGMDQIADEATRAAVSIYAIDPGVGAPGWTDAEIQTPARSEPYDRARAREGWRGAIISATARTGGLYFKNDNGLKELLARALDDQSSYYLLGYNPGSDSFDRKFHKISVRVLRPGVTVRSRTGYVGVEDGPAQPAESGARRMIQSLLGPFQVNDLHTRLNAAVRPDSEKGGRQGLLISRLWVDGRDLTFEKGTDGKFHTELEVAVASFNPQGLLRDHTEKAYRLSLTDAQLAEARRSGVLYSIYSPAAVPGPYHVRMAIRERGTERVGTASQFLVAPDLSKNRLAISGLLLKGLDDVDPDGFVPQPWLTLLRLGQGIDWEATAFRPKLKNGEPKLTVVLRLFRDEKLVQESRPIAITTATKKPSLMPISGSVSVEDVSTPGEYYLQLIVTDHNDKDRAAAQSVAFQVAPPSRPGN